MTTAMTVSTMTTYLSQGWGEPAFLKNAMLCIAAMAVMAKGNVKAA